MEHILVEQRTVNVAFVALAILVAACTAAASPQPESLLLSAGFKAKVATTAIQRQELKTLRQGQVSLVMQKGKRLYIFPVASSNQFYIGNDAQYQAYKQLTTPQRDSSAPVRRELITPVARIPVDRIYDSPLFEPL
jgi:hypothetical protein